MNAPAGPEPTPTEHLTALQTLRLKGRATAEDVANTTGDTTSAAEALLDALVTEGLARAANTRFRLTPPGRAALDEALEHERAGVNQSALNELYTQFETFNHELKDLASRWQQRGGAPNDHTDAGYDHRILEQLRDLDQRFSPLAERAAQLVPRLRRYPARFASAIKQINTGETRWFLAPIVDSYHTVWFELHEDLIGLTGRSREAEALAGRAE